MIIYARIIMYICIPSLCTKMYQDSFPVHFAKVREKLFICLESTSNGSWDQCHRVLVFLAFALHMPLKSLKHTPKKGKTCCGMPGMSQIRYLISTEFGQISSQDGTRETQVLPCRPSFMACKTFVQDRNQCNPSS